MRLSCKLACASFSACLCRSVNINVTSRKATSMAVFFPSNCDSTCKMINNRYKIMNEIGRGSFGSVHMGYDEASTKYVAIKLEQADSNGHGSRPRSQLKNEDKIYRILKGGGRIPKAFFYGSHHIDVLNMKFNVLVTELLGGSLEHYFNVCGRQFSIKTTLLLADQIVSLIEYLHYKCIIHRDIKPENFLMGPVDSPHENHIYIIDFGLAKSYRDVTTNEHISHENQRTGLVGTARYASVNALQGKVQSRRDDLEACAYMLVYFLRGSLPWQNISALTRREKYEMICEIKQSFTPRQLCEGLPSAFEHFLFYCRQMSFKQTPDYCYLKNLIHGEFRRHNLKNDYMYDWKLNTNNSTTSTETEPGQEQDLSQANSSSIEVVFDYTQDQIRQ